MRKVIAFVLGSFLAANLGMTVAHAAANEVRVAFFLEWATPNQEDKVKKAFDEALGVPVKWTNFATGGEMTEAMLSGDIDISYSQGLTPFVNAVNAKAPIKLVDIAVIYGMGGTTCVAAKGIDKGNASTKLDGQKVAVPLGASLLTVKEAQDAGIAGIDITSVTNKFLKENPGMVKTFVEVTHDANARFNAGKSDMSVIAKDAAMDLAGTTNQMDGFEFPDAATMKSKYLNKGGILMTYLSVMGNMFATSENPALSDYSEVVDTSYLP
jgi:ABC-type taurine transport system substrate-binding protein